MNSVGSTWSCEVDVVTVNIREAKTQLSKLVDRAVKGEAFVIAKAGKPQSRGRGPVRVPGVTLPLSTQLLLRAAGQPERATPNGGIAPPPPSCPTSTRSIRLV